jgi:hypothetical protein
VEYFSVVFGTSLLQHYLRRLNNILLGTFNILYGKAELLKIKDLSCCLNKLQMTKCDIGMRLASVKPLWGLLWGEKIETVKIAPTYTEVGMP